MSYQSLAFAARFLCGHFGTLCIKGSSATFKRSHPRCSVRKGVLRCSPVNSAKFLRTLFYKAPLDDCFCTLVLFNIREKNKRKIFQEGIFTDAFIMFKVNITIFTIIQEYLPSQCHSINEFKINKKYSYMDILKNLQIIYKQG